MNIILQDQRLIKSKIITEQLVRTVNQSFRLKVNGIEITATIERDPDFNQVKLSQSRPSTYDESTAILNYLILSDVKYKKLDARSYSITDSVSTHVFDIIY